MASYIGTTLNPLLRDLLEDRRLQPAAKMLMLRILIRDNPGGSIDGIAVAAETGYVQATAMVALADLVDTGWLSPDTMLAKTWFWLSEWVVGRLLNWGRELDQSVGPDA